jgi:hypothetical protein
LARGLIAFGAASLVGLVMDFLAFAIVTLKSFSKCETRLLEVCKPVVRQALGHLCART